jgi:hypothetical protein
MNRQKKILENLFLAVSLQSRISVSFIIVFEITKVQIILNFLFLLLLFSLGVQLIGF